LAKPPKKQEWIPGRAQPVVPRQMQTMAVGQLEVELPVVERVRVRQEL